MASLSCNNTANNRMGLGGARIDIVAVDQFLAKLDDYDSQYSKVHPGFECELDPLPASERTCCDFLNRLLHQLQPNSTVEFVSSGSIQPKDHCTGTSCRPDLVAVQKEKLRLPFQGNRGHTHPNPTDTSATVNTTVSPKWIDLEVVVAYHSRGETIEENIKQAVAYSGYLLMARPDRVAVLGLYIKSDAFAVVLVDPSRVYRTVHIPWKHALAKALFFRVLYYVGCPPESMIDPTIRRDDHGGFQITVNGTVHTNYRLSSIPTLGRWTMILKPEARGPVFKFQYLRPADLIPEGNILSHIHCTGDIPGVVHINWYGWVRRADGDIVACPTGDRRQKVCLELKDTGDLFMGINNPRDALIVIWDLLEVTRQLYTKRKVLHRDLSNGNVLVKKVHGLGANVPQETATPQAQEFCSIRHLLDKQHPRDDTPTLLIDFDLAILEPEQTDTPRQTVGTPIFMARAAVVGRHLSPRGPFCLVGLPRLSEKAHRVYKEILPDRLEQFPQPSEHQEAFIRKCPSGEQPKWAHELRHEAESAFWLLVWWAVHICPKSKCDPKDPNGSKPSIIPGSMWHMLTSVDINTQVDDRFAFLILLTLDQPWLDPAYVGMNTLFRQMARQIYGDLYWVTNGTGNKCRPEMEKPEFLHEAFQRLIFNFLIEHKDEEFMELETDATPRKAAALILPDTDLLPPGFSLFQRSSSRKRSRSEMERSDEEAALWHLRT